MSNSISQAFKALQLATADSPSEHENVFEVSYEYLSKIKNFNDVKAYQSCLVALINLDKYNKAYELIQKIPTEAIAAELVLEIAYVLYKVGKSDELMALVKQNHEALSGYYLFGIKNILAQNYYKIGKYKESLQLVQECIRESGAENTDLAVNERAVISQINFQNSHIVSNASTELDTQNYDLLFNESLVEFSKNNKQKALELLNRAESLCLEQNMGADKEDLLSELLPIRLNINYIKQNQGDLEGAIASLSEELKNIDSVHDDLLKLILKLNLYSCKQQQAGGELEDANLVFRDLQIQEVLNKLNQKLTKFQYHVLMKNNLLAKYTDGTLGTSLTSSHFLNQYFESFPNDLTALVYSILNDLGVTFDDLRDVSKKYTVRKKFTGLVTDERKNFATRILHEYVNKSLFQKNYRYGSFASMSKTIDEELKEDKLIPSVIGCYLNSGEDVHSLDDGWKEIVAQLKNKIVTSSAEDLTSDPNRFMLYKELGFLLIRKHYGTSCDDEASSKGKEILEALAAAAPEDKLLVAITTGDVSQLRDVEQLQAHESVDELIKEGVELWNSNKSIITLKPAFIQKKHRKRKPKFSPNKVVKPADEVSLDPERWLPMKVRSYYKPTKKERLKSSHQGAIERQSTPVSSSPAPSSATSNKTTAGTAANTSSSSSKKNKKKKKGKK